MSTAFQYENKHYKQLDDIAMCSPVSPVTADISMDGLERKAFSNYFAVPRMFHRFVDDIITVIKKTESQQLLQHLSNQNARIQFMMEKEANGILPFMDVKFSREEQGTLSRQVYQKPTHTNRYLLFTTHHPVSVKSGVVACLASRAITVSSNNALRAKELK